MRITFVTASHVSSHPSLFPQLRTGSFGAFLKHQTFEVSEKLLKKKWRGCERKRNTMKNRVHIRLSTQSQ